MVKLKFSFAGCNSRLEQNRVGNLADDFGFIFKKLSTKSVIIRPSIAFSNVIERG